MLLAPLETKQQPQVQADIQFQKLNIQGLKKKTWQKKKFSKLNDNKNKFQTKNMTQS